jgi:Flp pilus assembly protein TadG
MKRVCIRQRERGAVIITVCLLMLFLLGFIGVALDFGRLFIVKTELQTAMDSCALAAAQELNGEPTALTRATNAGLTAGNLNAVHLQSADWSGQGKLVAADITFRDPAFVTTTVAAIAKYAQCQHTQSGIQVWLMHAWAAMSGNTTDFPSTQVVWANAVATRANAQSTCPVPLALKPAVNTPPNYGFVPGQWITLLMGAGEATNGQIGWANLDGTNSAAETEAEMNGKCGTKVGDTLGTPGVQASIADAWNVRFGIYKNGVNPALKKPDYTGYIYTQQSWGTPAQNAYGGAPGAGAHSTAENFVIKRGKFASCDDDGTLLRGGGPGAQSCESISGLSLNSFQDVAVPGSWPPNTGGHGQFGTSRRIVLVPVVSGTNSVIDYACMLMLQPLSIPLVQVQLEYIGNAGVAGSPCTTSGMPGGSVGPLVPALVR